jgi:hypothetical protein
MNQRKGFAVLTVLLLTLAMAALAASAVYLAGNANLISTSLDKENEFRYSAEAALAMGKSRLNNDPLALPDSGFVTLMSDAPITGADGQQLPGVGVNLYIGPTGSTSGQFGRFASVVAEAHDVQGARFVRRLEVAQESFAKYAYWSNTESNNGQTIYFGGGDNLWGPVWSNDVIHIASPGATFHGDVGTAKTISGVQFGTFLKGYQINQLPITLPTNIVLGKLQGYASAGNMSFAAANSGAASAVRVRVEFVAVDLGTAGTDSTGVDEGFFKVYAASPGGSAWLRGDWNGVKASAKNCGAYYRDTPGAVKKFYPVSVHGQAWFVTALRAGGMTAQQAADTSNASMATILAKSTARCYLGGDSHLVAVERNSNSFTNAQKQIGGEDTTFTSSGNEGAWVRWPGVVDPRLAARRSDAAYLFPLYRGQNPGTKGVIYVDGTVGVSGVLRGRVTLYAAGTIVVVDDTRYATDPVSGRCADILGLIAAKDITIADNSLMGPQPYNPGGGQVYKNFDDSKDAYIQGVLMALQNSFGVENYGGGPTTTNGCEGTAVGRGCLYLTGGIIQQARGAVGQFGGGSGTGYVKRYSYDHCAAANPPPYFPTTGRFTDNRYFEIDPVRFDVAKLFARLVPGT